MLTASLTGIFSIVLLGPFVNRKIESNLELFLFLMGLVSATISGVWSAELIREGVAAPDQFHTCRARGGVALSLSQTTYRCRHADCFEKIAAPWGD